MLWNITEEAIQPLARTSMLHLGHSEEVTCLQWNPNTQGDVDVTFEKRNHDSSLLPVWMAESLVGPCLIDYSILLWAVN
jgi:hypothetical protein